MPIMSIFKKLTSIRRSVFFSIHLTASLAMLPTLALAADLVNGQTLYMIHCSSCHGEKGNSTNPAAPNFARGERLFQSDDALIDVVRSGNKAMPAFMGILQDREILDVISYAKTLQW